MKQSKYSEIINTIRREVIPAIGCTEPIAVALCTAQATKILGSQPTAINVSLSPNIYKNAMGVGIPNTGMTGLPIAIALGATIGDAAAGLEVLRLTDDKAVKEAVAYIERYPIKIDINTETEEILFIEVSVSNETSTASATIETTHTNFTKMCRDGKPLSDATILGMQTENGQQESSLELTLRDVYEFATNAAIEDIEFIWKSAEMNKRAAEISFTGNYGHGLGKLLHDKPQNSIFGKTLFTKILSYTSGACDARMSGAMVPVMSNSGSGNQGISATIPVVIFGEEHNSSHEDLVRALTLSHLTVIYIKESLGRLSALCGCVVAATGSSCGITYLMGGGYEEITYAVKNMVANITGMICDGAKPSCSLKVTSGVATAILSAALAMEHRHTTSLEGIIDDDVDLCIKNLTDIGRFGMRETDRVILNIMRNK